ncbi:MAG: TonB-dependent receptor [Proteobacteria bacterium]|nr:TonB-dependent receptor [Pseudomonadota bacterium]
MSTSILAQTSRTLACALWLALTGMAGADSPQPADFTLYETESSRRPSRVIETPAAVSVLVDDEIRRARPAASLDEALQLVPGVFAQGGRNFAQDSRISIRGYGARAAFGVRGIRLYVDGVPSTLPDGLSEVDSLDLEFAERIDVVRSQLSSLYGGGGGGAVMVDTLSPTPERRFRGRALLGSDRLTRYSATATGTSRGFGYAFGLARTRARGYREHARGDQTALLAKLERSLAAGWQLRGGLSLVWAPEAQDPGGLNLAEVRRDRTQAHALSVSRNAREKLNQQKLWLRLRRAFGEDHDLRLTGYALRRDFANALPINRRVDLDRTVFGGSAVYRRRTGPVLWTLGADLDVQRDLRLNHANLSGARGPLQLEQSERVRSLGPWLQADLRLSRDWTLIAGARYDRYEFVVGDRFTRNGDRSDRLRFRQISPRLGLHWNRSRTLQLYANLASAFRAPTTTELAPVDSAGGFLSDLDPETTRGLEIGAKGLLGQRLAYDVAAFDLHLRNVAVPFETPTGDDIFRDAGRVRRRGLEVALSALLHPAWTARVAYTYADYRYRDFDSPGGRFDGRREPNTPEHSVSAELRFDSPSGWFAVLSLRHFSDIEVDDANSAESRGATLAGLRAGRDFDYRGRTLRPFAGLRNFTRAKYDQTLRPNAFGGRYYEPAPLIEAFVGLEVLSR